MMSTESDGLEAALTEIPDLKAVRVVTDDDAKPIEVHVVATGAKTPKQIVRDVQTVAQATVGIAIDHRIVSVVQFPDEERGVVPPELRVLLDEITTKTTGTNSEVKVVLTRGDSTAAGEASGITSAEGLLRLAASAAIESVKGLQPDGQWLALEDVALIRMGPHEVAIATVVMGTGPLTVSGSAVVAGQATDAAVRAVLDALNRRLFT